jgi:hypothetical protein
VIPVVKSLIAHAPRAIFKKLYFHLNILIFVSESHSPNIGFRSQDSDTVASILAIKPANYLDEGHFTCKVSL